MKHILADHYEIVKSDILDYLSSYKDQFSDIRIVKSIKLHIIDDSDEQSWHRQQMALRQQILESEERYDLKWLSVLLLDLISEDFENVAYILKKINYDKLSKEIDTKLELLRRVTRLVYLYNDDNIIDALENLMQHPASNSISTSEILWLQYHYYESEEIDYDLLVNMAKIILKHRESEYPSYFFLGFLFVEQELFAQALEAYEKALELCLCDPALYDQVSWLYMRKSDCLFNLKRYHDVIKNTDHAHQFYNKYNVGHDSELEFFHFVYRLRCRSFFVLKQYSIALVDANSALDYCKPENRDAMLGLIDAIEKHCCK